MKGQNFFFFPPVDSLVLERLLYGISWGMGGGGGVGGR